MMRSLTFLSLLAYLSPAVAMDNQNTVDISIQTQFFMYLGTCPDRTRLEEAYGCTFPVNTIFVQVTFNPYDKQFRKLDLIPYDYIREKNEGDIISLTINGKQHSIRCKHLGNDHFWGATKFEDMMKYGIELFSERANWYPCKEDGQKILVNEKVISPNSPGSRHGENKSPFVQ